MIKIRKATYLDGWRIHLEFSTGECGEIDLTEIVARSGSMVAPLKDIAYFQTFFLEFGALSWPNGFDLSPHSLYQAAQTNGSLRQVQAA